MITARNEELSIVFALSVRFRSHKPEVTPAVKCGSRSVCCQQVPLASKIAQGSRFFAFKKKRYHTYTHTYGYKLYSRRQGKIKETGLSYPIHFRISGNTLIQRKTKGRLKSFHGSVTAITGNLLQSSTNRSGKNRDIASVPQ